MGRSLPDPTNEVGVERFRQIQRIWEEGGAEAPSVLVVRVDRVDALPWIVVGGVGSMVRATENIRVPGQLIAKLRATGEFSEPFLEFLRPLRFALDIFAVSEGEVVLPGTPLVQICGRLVDCLLFGDFARNSVEEGTWAASLAHQCRDRARGLPLFFAPSADLGGERLMHVARGCRIAGWDGTVSSQASECAGLSMMEGEESLHESAPLALLEPEAVESLTDRVMEASSNGIAPYVQVRHLAALDALVSLKGEGKARIAGILLDPLALVDAGTLAWSQGIAPAPETVRVVRRLDEQGTATGDNVYSEGEELPSGARSLMERYTDRGRTCRPIPEPARSEVLLARAQEELGQVDSGDSAYLLQWSTEAEGIHSGIKA